MARNTRKFVGAFIVVILILASLALRDSGPALPNPNGYDDFVKAGELVTWPLDSEGRWADYRELSLQDLRASAFTNAEALSMVRRALERQCRVPIQNTTDWLRNHLSEMQSLKRLTDVFLLAGRLAQVEGQTNDAVSIYLDSIRFAQESNRGGLVIHTAVARTQEALGLQGIKSVESALDARQCRQIVQVLETLDAQQEPWEKYFKRDLRYTLRAEFKGLFSLSSWRAQQNLKTRFHQAQLQRRQTMVGFAARACELETGSKPANAEALVPVYLTRVPNEPISGRQLSVSTNQSPR